MCKVVEVACAPLYQPTFDNVYKNTLHTGCGSDRSSCHSASGHQAGVSFETPAIAYAALTDPAHQRVKPGDPGCSQMIVRTDSPGTDYQMPPGDPLSAPERCALIQWVQCGAPGPGSGSGTCP